MRSRSLFSAARLERTLRHYHQVTRFEKHRQRSVEDMDLLPSLMRMQDFGCLPDTIMEKIEYKHSYDPRQNQNPYLASARESHYWHTPVEWIRTEALQRLTRAEKINQAAGIATMAGALIAVVFPAAGIPVIWASFGFVAGYNAVEWKRLAIAFHRLDGIQEVFRANQKSAPNSTSEAQ